MRYLSGANAPSAAENSAAVAAAISPAIADVQTAIDNLASYIVSSVAREQTVETVIAALPPTLTFAYGTLSSSAIIAAVPTKVIKVYGLILWSLAGAAYQLAYTDGDGSNDVRYQTEDIQFTDNGLGDPRTSALPMLPTGVVFFETPGGKAFAAIGDGDLSYMVWFTQE